MILHIELVSIPSLYPVPHPRTPQVLRFLSVFHPTQLCNYSSHFLHHSQSQPRATGKYAPKFGTGKKVLQVQPKLK